MGLCWNRNERCRSTNSSAKPARTRFERIQKFTDPQSRGLPELRQGSGDAGCSRLPRSSSRDPGSTSPTTPRSRTSGGRAARAAAPRASRSGSTKSERVRANRERSRLQVDRLVVRRSRPSRRRSPPTSKTEPARDRPSRRVDGPARRGRGRAGTRGRAPRDPAGAARSTRPPSGIPACCRCRGARR